MGNSNGIREIGISVLIVYATGDFALRCLYKNKTLLLNIYRPSFENVHLFHLLDGLDQLETRTLTPGTFSA